MNELKNVLEYLEDRLLVDHIEKAERRHIKALNYENIDHLPLKISGVSIPFLPKKYNEVFSNMEAMLYNELLDCVRLAVVKDDSLPMIRANYGVGTLPSLFGIKSRVIADTDLPWCDEVKSIEDIDRIISRGVPDLSSGFGKRVIGTYDYYKEQLENYPKCKQVIKFYHPDLQGPFDVAHLIWGSDIYMAFYDAPDKVHSLMQVITDTYIAYMKKIKKYIKDEINGGMFNYHWGVLYKGKIVLRNDSMVSVSPAIYEEFIRPYDEQILASFNTGSTHFCGRADQNVFLVAKAKNNVAMNFGYMSNIEFGETYLEKLKEEFVINKIAIVNYFLSPEEYGHYKYTFKTGITLETSASSINEAKVIMEGCK